MLIYATPAELSTWRDGAASPTNAASLLRSASLLVRNATRGDVYDVNETTGMPTDAAVLEALRDATTAQVSAWIALGVDPAAGPAQPGGGLLTEKSIGSAKLVYSVSPGTSVEDRASTLHTLTGEARMILGAAGLLEGRVYGYGR